MYMSNQLVVTSNPPVFIWSHYNRMKEEVDKACLPLGMRDLYTVRVNVLLINLRTRRNTGRNARLKNE